MTPALLTRTSRRLPFASSARRACLTLILAVLTSTPQILAATAGDKLVTIDGGADQSRHNYEWFVTNHHSSPIVYVEFPHYRADAFTVPPLWKAETTYLVNVGVPDKPGVCIARPEPPNTGISKGGSLRFEMRITAKGAAVGRGRVKIRFADGKETVIEGVILPEPPPSDFKLLPLVGAALIFGGWVVIRALRDRRRKQQTPERESGAIQSESTGPDQES